MIFKAKSIEVTKDCHDIEENLADVDIEKEINITNNVNDHIDNDNTKAENTDKITSEKSAKSTVKKSPKKSKNKKVVATAIPEDENIEEIKTAGVIADEINEAAAAATATHSKFQQFKVKYTNGLIIT